ncbi:MAG: GNAT family N-acetyltransferase [Hyphomicrobiaceae bacterium]|nr:GNAT family N-acetyltransferase [Hyphomicrobiaceae bacterium]
MGDGRVLPDAASLRLPCPDHCSEAVEDADTCPVLHLSPGCADAATHPAIPARQRRKLRMARHRLSRSPGAAVVATRERTPRQWLDALVETHTTRWEGRGLPGVLADPRTRAFHGDALAGLVERGIARLFALRIGGGIAGVYYGFSHCGRAYGYLGGFDPRFAYYSPGTVLLGHAIEDAMREGVRELHLLRGGEAYKYAWGAVDRHTLKLTFVRHTGHG